MASAMLKQGLLAAAMLAGAIGMRAAAITTSELDAEHYRIRVSDLPPPEPRESTAKPPRTRPVPADAKLYAPAGFEVTVFADEVKQARWLALTPEGDVLVTSSRGDDIVRLRDRDRDGVAEARQVFATKENGVKQPFGMVFADEHLFIAGTEGVYRFDYRRGQEKLEGKGARIYALPGGGYNQHWTRNLMLAPDGQHFLLTVGSGTNVSVDPAPRASVLRMKLDGSDVQTVASGLRNPVGLAFEPNTGDPYVVVNERDGLGNELVPDYFTRIEDGEFFGWPYAYLDPSRLDPRRLRDGVSEDPELAARTQTPDVLFAAHSAPLGLTFYRGKMFPSRYRQGAFVAFHGSWNRSRGTGYKLVFVPFDLDHRPAGGYEDFVTGFLSDPKTPAVWGRPVGLLELPDGSLLFSDDANSRVYRVAYHERGDNKAR